ncbi:transcriptional regulator [Flavobacterium album]|uniref:Transcriptional regulator n=1 Tax=Flavobacterium album TaxID=2175091 RepID=A0A2S1R1H6_9FLAO|nr:transcriptional regulator [Flavobacterium album]AWH86462.1 transcriptional regulator [Flavobacterium album]
MKSILEHIDKTLEHRIRLGIMSILMVNEYADFRTLKELLGVTDGSLSGHLKALETENYITIGKQFTRNKPITRYTATKEGRVAFSAHIADFEKLIRKERYFFIYKL